MEIGCRLKGFSVYFSSSPALCLQSNFPARAPALQSNPLTHSFPVLSSHSLAHFHLKASVDLRTPVQQFHISLALLKFLGRKSTRQIFIDLMIGTPGLLFCHLSIPMQIPIITFLFVPPFPTHSFSSPFFFQFPLPISTRESRKENGGTGWRSFRQKERRNEIRTYTTFATVPKFELRRRGGIAYYIREN